VSRSRITVSQFLTDWLESIKPRVRETTWVSYRMAVERITRQIGAVQLQSLTPLQVEGLYATLLERSGSRRPNVGTEDGPQLSHRAQAGAGRRRVSLDTVTFDALRAHRMRQLEERLALGDVWSNDGDLVFTDELGGPVHPDRFSKSFDRIVRDAELPRIRLHDLRHSYATLALKAGVHPKVVSERLGHSTIAITLDLYPHVAQGLDADAAELVASRIYGTST
jgi:integrase